MFNTTSPPPPTHTHTQEKDNNMSIQNIQIFVSSKHFEKFWCFQQTWNVFIFLVFTKKFNFYFLQ